MFFPSNHDLDKLDSYIRCGAQRAIETMGNNFGVDGIYIHWFGWGGMRWKPSPLLRPVPTTKSSTECPPHPLWWKLPGGCLKRQPRCSN